jgi:rhodanese-related sulfurtransferase
MPMNLRNWIPGLLATVALAAAATAGDALRPVSQDALAAAMNEGDDAPFVLDVRSPEEFVAGHVPGAVNVPYDQVATRLAEVPRDKDVVLYCRSGRRAGIAAQVLAQNGYTRLQHLEGDMPAWIAQGRPTETPKDAAACLAALTRGGAPQKACASN